MARTEILTLENFWNDLKEKYPNSMKEYCDWVDEFKKDVDWLYLFRDNSPAYPNKIKAHSLPIALQLGIFLQFVSEKAKYSTFCMTEDWKRQITNWFKYRERDVEVEVIDINDKDGELIAQIERKRLANLKPALQKMSLMVASMNVANKIIGAVLSGHPITVELLEEYRIAGDLVTNHKFPTEADVYGQEHSK